MKEHPCLNCIVDPVCKKICEKFISFYDEHGETENFKITELNKKYITTELRKNRYSEYVLKSLLAYIDNKVDKLWGANKCK